MGIVRRNTRRTAAGRGRGMARESGTPCFLSTGSWTATCTAPERRIDHETTLMRMSPSAGRKGQTSRSTRMQQRFWKAGASEGMANDFRELRTPMTRAARQISGAYGSMMRRSGMISSQRSCSGSQRAIAYVARMPRTVMALKRATVMPATADARRSASRLPSLAVTSA